MSHVLSELGKYSDKGTMIYWPWGDLQGQDEYGRIRVVPWLVGFPMDGPEAKKYSCVR